MMGSFKSTDRNYRRFCNPGPGELSFQVVVEESDLWVTARQDLRAEIGEYLHRQRGIIRAYMLCHPEFGPSLVPVRVCEDAPVLIKEMARAAEACSVGPMAAVAGAIAQRTADEFVKQSPDIIIENGGDIYMHSTRDRIVGLLPDPKKETSLGLEIRADEFPTAICASSARIGHSLSLGQGDLVVVKSRGGYYADAAATALCNILKGGDGMKKLVRGIDELAKKGGPEDLQGVFAQHQGRVAVWGDIRLTAV